MKASAIKRGRNPKFPYVAVVIRENGTTHNTNTKTAYATREEAVAFAQKWIDRAQELEIAQNEARRRRHGLGVV